MAWTHPINWDLGHLVTVAELNTYHRDNLKDLYTIVSKQTADLTKNNNTTFANLVGMSFAVLSGEVWCFHAWSYCVSNATADAKWTVTTPAASTQRFGVAGSGTPLTAGNETVSGNPVAFSFSGVNNTVARLSGFITAGTNGTVQLQAAQNTATVVDTIFFINSFIVAQRVSA